MKVAKQSLVVLIFALAISALLGFGAAVADPSIAAPAAGPAPGVYVISCFMQAPNVVPCLTDNEIPLGTPLTLNAHVTDSSGNLAEHGMLIFQDCLSQGIPAPSIQCDSGSGVWSTIQHEPIMSRPTAADTKVGYGSPSTAQTIGFRFRYLGGSGGIPNGISNSMDVTWS